MIMLLVVGVLVYFGLAQRLLDRMRLTDKQALLFIVAIVGGSFIDIPLMRTPVELSVNAGGAILPAALAIWLLTTADETAERVRAVVASILVAGAVMLGSYYLPYEPENMFLDPKLIYGIAAGLIAYLAGRSRRSAFIGGVLGIIISDIVHFVTIMRAGIPGTTSIGGAGAFDVVIIAGLVGVMIAELVGETREKIQGGPVLGPNRPEGLYEFSKELGHHNKHNKEKSVDTAQKDDRQDGGEEHE
jgi:Predicted membrane protein